MIQRGFVNIRVGLLVKCQDANYVTYTIAKSLDSENVISTNLIKLVHVEPYSYNAEIEMCFDLESLEECKEILRNSILYNDNVEILYMFNQV